MLIVNKAHEIRRSRLTAWRRSQTSICQIQTGIQETQLETCNNYEPESRRKYPFSLSGSGQDSTIPFTEKQEKKRKKTPCESHPGHGPPRPPQELVHIWHYLLQTHLWCYKMVERTIPQSQQNTVLNNTKQADRQGASSIPGGRVSVLQSLSHGITSSEDTVAHDAVEQKGLPCSGVNHRQL